MQKSLATSPNMNSSQSGIPDFRFRCFLKLGKAVACGEPSAMGVGSGEGGGRGWCEEVDDCEQVS